MSLLSRYLHRLKHFFALVTIFSTLPLCSSVYEGQTAVAKQAEVLFLENLYKDAIPLYTQLYASSQDEPLRTEWALRLSSCLLAENQPQEAIAILSSLPATIYPDDISFLMSQAYKQIHDIENSLFFLQYHLKSKHLTNNELVVLEKSYHLIGMGDFLHAKELINSIPKSIDAPTPYYFGQVQLAKIAFLQGEHNKALTILSQPFPAKLKHLTLYLKGWTYIALQNGFDAATCFEELLCNAPYSTSYLKGLIASMVIQTHQNAPHQRLEALFSKGESILIDSLRKNPDEISYLLLNDLLLIRAKTFQDRAAFTRAKELLNSSNFISSPQLLHHGLIKLAAAAPSYEERNFLYSQLLSRFPNLPSLDSKTWLYKGNNDLDEGLRAMKITPDRALPFFQSAAEAFSQSIILAPSAQAYLSLAIAHLHLPSSTNTHEALATLDLLIQNQELLNTLPNPKAVAPLFGWATLRLGETSLIKKAQKILVESPRTPHTLLILGMLSIQLEEWSQADKFFDTLLQEESLRSWWSPAWFWKGYCANFQHQEAAQRECFYRAYANDPTSPYAPLAYFYSYSLTDYMQSKKKAIKHLQAMPTLFPNDPLLINAYYLIGLYHNRNFFSEEGILLRKKDLTKAIDAFQQGEMTYDTLLAKGAIPPQQSLYLASLRDKIQLERAKANFCIAQNSSGGKREIYLEYAEEVFKELNDHFEKIESANISPSASDIPPYSKLWAESEFSLAKVYIEKGKSPEAEKVLNSSLERYKKANIQEGYGLMRTYILLGHLKAKENPHQIAIALSYFQQAEKCGKQYLSSNPSEKLDLWIQQSQCYREMKQLDDAMRILSRVINDDVISPLRIKAMVLRSEIYELQGRPELAMKQLEAASHKGGEWACKAKEKLEQTYGFSPNASNRH